MSLPAGISRPSSNPKFMQPFLILFLKCSFPWHSNFCTASFLFWLHYSLPHLHDTPVILPLSSHFILLIQSLYICLFLNYVLRSSHKATQVKFFSTSKWAFQIFENNDYQILIFLFFRINADTFLKDSSCEIILIYLTN